MPIDMAPPPPPARTARKATTPRAKAVAQNPDGHKSPDASVSPMFHARRQGLAGLAQVAQMGCLAFGLKADAAAIGMHSTTAHGGGETRRSTTGYRSMG